MSTIQTILMGDVVGSSSLDSTFVQESLQEMVQAMNKDHKASILSPLTITLGDEFQGICADSVHGVNLLLEFELYRLEHQLPYQLHFVLLEGSIDTEINKETAYGMLGSGLTEARELLSSKKRDRNRFEVLLKDELMAVQLSRLFSVLDGISESWKVSDFPLILDMLKQSNNQMVADQHQKTRAQIWKRRKTLQVEHYRTIQEVILDLINQTT
jgi:hypothetical protein